MRSVLAVDMMLAKAVAKKLTGEVRQMDHMAMRDAKGAILRKLRAMLDEVPSVLAIGGKKWVERVLPFLAQWI